MERVRRVELLSQLWKSWVMPLYDTRLKFDCRGAENRTQTKRSQSVYTTTIRHPDILDYIQKNTSCQRIKFMIIY